MLSTIHVVNLVLFVALLTGYSAEPPPGTFGLTGDVVTLPMQMVNEFPMIAARVNGVAGRLMFDTGYEDALSLNDKAVPLSEGKVVGKGFVGSGQSFEVKIYPKVATVDLAGSLAYRDVPQVRGQDLSFVAKGAGADFLGFLGHRFFEGYLFKLDYANQRLTFYRQTPARRTAKDFLKDETVLTVIPFEIRKLPNHPIVPLKIGEESFVACFDTGQLGGLYVDKETRTKLDEKGLLARAVGGQGTFNIKSIVFSPSFTASDSGTRVFDSPFSAAKPLGVTERNVISLGYSFLRQYKTVWDYGERKLYLLKP